jgi:hypothetical protein
MRETSVPEQRYQAVLAVVGEGRTVTEVAAQWSRLAADHPCVAG